MVVTELFEYGDKHSQYEGLLVYPENADGKLPCVLVCPTVWGRTEMEESAAVALANLGYVALVVMFTAKVSIPVPVKQHLGEWQNTMRIVNFC